jgi:activator of HSP90 ATPase
MQRMNTRVSRRQLGFVLGGLGVVSVRAEAEKPGTTIHQESDYKATAARIYAVLLDSKQFSAATHDTAEIDPRAGGAFRLFGGRIEGRNIELVPNQRIVQAWRPAYWPPGVYSIVRFELVSRGSGTRIVFDQAGIAEEQWEHLSEGWRAHYWDQLRDYLNHE